MSDFDTPRVHALKRRLARLRAQTNEAESKLLKEWNQSQNTPDDDDPCECMGLGWECFCNFDPEEFGLDLNWNEIQRCDLCGKHDNDEQAAYLNFEYVILVYHGPGECPTYTVFAKGPLSEQGVEAVADHHRRLFLDEALQMSRLTSTGGEA